MNKYRTHSCSELTDNDVGKQFHCLVGYTEKGIMEIYYL